MSPQSATIVTALRDEPRVREILQKPLRVAAHYWQREGKQVALHACFMGLAKVVKQVSRVLAEGRLLVEREYERLDPDLLDGQVGAVKELQSLGRLVELRVEVISEVYGRLP